MSNYASLIALHNNQVLTQINIQNTINNKG